MASPKELRLALAANLAPLGFHQVAAYSLANPTPPAAFVQGPSIEYDGSFGRGDDEWTFTVVVLVGYATDEGAQQNLDEYLEAEGAMSIKALIESDKKLGGACQDLRVTEATGPRLYAAETLHGSTAPPALGCEWTVQVIA